MGSTRSRVARPWAAAAPLIAILLLVAASSVATIAAPGAGAAAAARTLAVLPATGLTNQAVQVNWTGFTPTTASGLNQVIVVQCKGKPTSLADCFTDQPFPSSANGTEVVTGFTRPDGSGTAELEVRPAAQLPALGCVQADPCSVLAYENQVVAAGHLPTLLAMATISFGRSTDDCPSVTNLDVRAEGEASASPVMYDWASQRCVGANHFVLDYTETSSDAGRQSFLQRLTDVAVTSIAATPAELKAVPGAPKFSYAPLDLTSVAVVYNMRDPTSNKPITDLTLSPRLLARLISDTDLGSFFQDPELTRLNPHHTFPVTGASTPLIRAEANADTWVTTNWIAHDANAAAFLRGNDPDRVVVDPSYKGISYPTDIFENRALDDAYLPREGEAATVQHVFYGARPRDTSPLDPAQTGFIGVVDLAAANRFDLPTAKLINRAGKAVAPTAAGILAGYHAMVAGPSGTLVANPASTDPAAYPLVKVDYAMVPKVTDLAHARHITDALTWGATTGQTGLPPGYVPLPPALVVQTKQVAAGIKTPVVAATPTTARPTTTGPVTTTTAPATVLPSDTGSCCSDSGSGGSSSLVGSSLVGSGSSGGRANPVAAGSAAVTRNSGSAKTAPTTIPVEGGTPSVVGPSAVIAAAGAPFALPVLFASGLLAALLVAIRRLWPRLLRPRRALGRLLRISRAPAGVSGAT